MKFFIDCSSARIPKQHVLGLDPGLDTGFCDQNTPSYAGYKARHIAEISEAQMSDFRRRRFAPEHRGVASGKFIKRGRRPPEQRLGIGPDLRLLAVAALAEQFE